MIQYKNRRLLLKVSFLLSAAVVAGFCFMLYYSGMYPFGSRSLMRIDLDTQYADFIQFFARSTLAEKLYSFQKGFGGPTLGFISYYAISPFNLLVLFFSPENLETAIFVILAAKFVFMAQGMYFYLCSHYENLYANAALALAYAFFPVFARWYYHIIWLDCFALLPLLILTTEQVIHYDKKRLFIAFYVWSLVSNYYITVMSSMFILLYFVYYTLAVMEYNIKIVAKKAFSMAEGALTGIMLASPVLLPSFIQLVDGKLAEATITTNHAGQMFQPVYLLSSFFEGMYIYNVPQIADGVCCVFILSAFFANRNISLKLRMATAAFMLFMVYSMYSGTLHYVWHGFSNPIAFYFRHNYLVAFLVVVRMAHSLEKLDFPAVAYSLPVTLVLYAVCFVMVKKDSRLPQNTRALTLSLICILLCAGAMLMYRFRPQASLNGLCVLIALSAVVNGAVYSATDKTVYDSVYPTNPAGDYRRNYINVRSALDIAEDGFYRAADTDARDYNQPMGVGYYGTNHYSSTFDRNQKEMFVHFGYPDTFYSTIYSHSDPLTDSLWGVKYLLSAGKNLSRQYNLVKQGENGQRSLYENPYRLPLIFTGATNNVEFINYYPQHIERMLYALTGEKVLNDDYSTNYTALGKASDEINSNAAEILYENGGIIKLKASGEYLLSTIMYDENWYVWVNGNKTVPEKFMEYFLSVPLGGSAEVTMIYIPRGFVPGLLIMAAALCLLMIKRYTNKEKKDI